MSVRYPLRICLIQHSTRSDNMGVGALTISQVDILRDIARDLGRDLRITIIDWKGLREPYVNGPDIEIIDIDRNMILSPNGLFSMFRRSDVVIDIGAGDSFADIYGVQRLKRMFFMKGLVHLSGTPLVLAPQTIGPFVKPWSKRLAKMTMRRSVLVATRDRLSTEHAHELGYGDVIEASDVALRLAYDSPAPRDPEAATKVGINVSGLLMGRGYTGKNEFGIQADYPRLIRDLIRFFRDEGCEVHLVAHVYPAIENSAHLEDDTAANATLIEEFPDVIAAPRFATPSEAKSYIAGLDFFMGARMHACIAAFSTGVPVVPMAYSRKFEGLFGTIGYDRTVDCTSETAEGIEKSIRIAYANRKQLAEEIEISYRRGIEKLAVYEKRLREILS